MAKKVVNRNISRAVIPISEKTWLIQPLNVTMMRHDYSSTQNKVLVSIIQKLQSSIRQVLDTRQPEQLELFTATHLFGNDVVTDNDVILRIPTKELVHDRRRFAEVMEGLDALVRTPISMPIKDKNGKKYIERAGLCTVILPTTYKGDTDILIKLKKDVALRMVDVNEGYTSYLKEVISTSKNKYEQRFYWIISAWKDRGETNPIPVIELRKTLRLEDKYPRWDMFYKKVIEPARESLRTRAEAGDTDLYFEDELIYKGSKKRGEPDAIKFHVLQSAAGKEYQIERGNNAQRLKLEEFLRDTFQQTRTNVIGIMKRVTSENVAELSNFLTSLEMKIKQQGEKISSVKAWSHRSITGWLDDWEQARTAQLEMQFAPNTATETQTSEKVAIAIYSDEDAAKWNDALALVKKAIAKDTFDVWFSALMLGKCSNNSITIWAPTALYIEMMAAKSDNILAESIAITFGPDTVINYVVGKEKRPK